MIRCVTCHVRPTPNSARKLRRSVAPYCNAVAPYSMPELVHDGIGAGAGKEEMRAHPLPVTVAHIEKGVQQLRKIEANTETALDAVDLYRGLAGKSISDEFLAKGGTELAPMSTTRDLKVAVQYSASGHAVILRLRTQGFMDRGADISFLSAFPGEAEVLFPPLTYLGPVREKDENGLEQNKPPQVIKVGDAVFTIVDVQPKK